MKEARKISWDLVERRLAACVNILPITSFYRWKNKLMSDHEYLLLIKTRTQRSKQVEERILALHSYQLPEIVLVRISDGLKPYLKWIDSETR